MSSKAFQVEFNFVEVQSFYLVFIVLIIYSLQISIFMKLRDHEAP